VLEKRIAVVGGGYWGKNLVRNFHGLGALHVICDTEPRRLAAFGKEYGVATSASFDDVLADPEVDAVALATPAEHHAVMVRSALERGKDVFVEKPLALTPAEGAELCALAKRTGRVLMVGHLLHYHGAVRKLKQLVATGELGRVQYVYSNRLNLGKIRREENILWSFAPHDVSLVLSLANETPENLACQGGAYLHEKIADVTVSTLSFASGLRAHIFVSWLHPYKEQKLVVVGDRKMAVFDDLEPENKLVLYEHGIEWKEGMPIPLKGDAEPVAFDRAEPLREECAHFIECVATRATPITDGEEGLRVLRVLGALQRSLDAAGAPTTLKDAPVRPWFAHPTATVDDGCVIGAGTKVWHYSHVSKGSVLGRGCNLGQNVFVAPGVVMGDNVKVQNNVSLYEGVELGDDVFCGPSMVFTNVLTPRSHVSRKDQYARTRVGRGATLGANSTIVCGHDVGEFAFVGAGAVVTKNVVPHALVVGNPARQLGWMCQCGERLPETLACESCGSSYREKLGRLTPATDTAKLLVD
jgi:UDP-2-acetamido-3-amino-2,3-dideoxy-glucuronate N-acetyltransferase